MSANVSYRRNGIRPALVSDEAFALLDELRRFRHFFRHEYSTDLKPENLADLLSKAERLKPVHRRDAAELLGRITP